MENGLRIKDHLVVIKDFVGGKNMGSKRISKIGNVEITKGSYKSGKSIYWVKKLPYHTGLKKFHKLSNARKYQKKLLK